MNAKLSDLHSDPFQEWAAVRMHRDIHLLGARVRFESNSEDLLRLVDSAYGGLPRHKLSRVEPRLRVRLVLTSRERKRARVEEGAFGDVAPIHDRCSELRVAIIDCLRKVVAGTNLGDDVIADLEKSLQQGVVEFQDFDGAFVPQLAQRESVPAYSRFPDGLVGVPAREQIVYCLILTREREP